MWNVRDDTDPLTAAYSRVMDEASHGASIDRGHFDHAAIESLSAFSPLTLFSTPSHQTLTLDA